MREWLVYGGLFENPPNLRDPSVAYQLRELIDVKESNLAALNFGSTSYCMLPVDIYMTLKEMLHYAKRKLYGKGHVEAQNIIEVFHFSFTLLVLPFNFKFLPGLSLCGFNFNYFIFNCLNVCFIRMKMSMGQVKKLAIKKTNMKKA